MPDTSFSRGFSVQVLADYETVCREAAAKVVQGLRTKPDLLLCASAGGSPTGLYARLAERRTAEPQLFHRLRVIQIDEWGGLPPGHPAACKTDLEEKLIRPLGISEDRFISLASDTRDPEAEAQRVGTWLREHGPIDICVLGLGLNGHIAMNEPATTLVPRAHVAALAESSMQHAMLRQMAQKPTWGLTLGMADILNSDEILLIVNGARKRQAVARLLQQKIDSDFPASFLWLHPAASLLCDNEAFGLPISEQAWTS